METLTIHEKQQAHVAKLRERGLPIYRTDEPDEEGLYLALFHGFPDEEARAAVDDWGSDGPVIGPLEFVHTTYAQHIKMRFTRDEDRRRYFPDENNNTIHWTIDDLVSFAGFEYGDWTVFYHKPEN